MKREKGLVRKYEMEYTFCYFLHVQKLYTYRTYYTVKLRSNGFEIEVANDCLTLNNVRLSFHV